MFDSSICSKNRRRVGAEASHHAVVKSRFVAKCQLVFWVFRIDSGTGIGIIGGRIRFIFLVLLWLLLLLSHWEWRLFRIIDTRHKFIICRSVRSAIIADVIVVIDNGVDIDNAPTLSLVGRLQLQALLGVHISVARGIVRIDRRATVVAPLAANAAAVLLELVLGELARVVEDETAICASNRLATSALRRQQLLTEQLHMRRVASPAQHVAARVGPMRQVLHHCVVVRHLTATLVADVSPVGHSTRTAVHR